MSRVRVLQRTLQFLNSVYIIDLMFNGLYGMVTDNVWKFAAKITRAGKVFTHGTYFHSIKMQGFSPLNSFLVYGIS